MSGLVNWKTAIEPFLTDEANPVGMAPASFNSQLLRKRQS